NAGPAPAADRSRSTVPLRCLVLTGMIEAFPARFSRTFPLAQYMREASAGRLMIACRQAGTFLSRRAAGRVRRAGARRARRGRLPAGSESVSPAPAAFQTRLSAAGASVN